MYVAILYLSSSLLLLGLIKAEATGTVVVVVGPFLVVKKITEVTCGILVKAES